MNLNEVPLLAVYTYRWSELLPWLIQSIGETAKGGSYQLAVINEQGSANENMHRAVRTARLQGFRYVILLDDDIRFTGSWLERVMGVLRRPDGPGIVGCRSHVPGEIPSRGVVPEIERAWVPGYLMAADLLKVKADPDPLIPGDKGMGDLEWCLAAQREGYKVLEMAHVSVAHPQKPLAPNADETCKIQVEYVLNKHGLDVEAFLNFRAQNLAVCQQLRRSA